MDYVAGWLGTLPEFVDSYWGIDPLRRQSNSVIKNLVDLADFNSLSEFLKTYNCVLDSNAQMTFATKSHRISHEFFPLIDSNILKLCYIDIGTADIHTLAWEFVIKTYTRPIKLNSDSEHKWQVDTLLTHPFTNEKRINALLDQFTQHTNWLRNNQTLLLPKFDHVVLNYSKLFQPGGSRYLCQCIGITVDDPWHDFYDYMLPMAETPAEILIWDHVFQKNTGY